MFRTSLIRTAAQASRIATGARVPVARRAAVVVAPRFAAVKAVRMYSAAAGLKKEEVEGRILGILQGFDKVSVQIHSYYMIRRETGKGNCLCWG
jgi:NADH dehydrogenase (ubiquinone) 1 alpha/beta subcomplex 1, acyl-carrier protein